MFQTVPPAGGCQKNCQNNAGFLRKCSRKKRKRTLAAVRYVVRRTAADTLGYPQCRPRVPLLAEGERANRDLKLITEKRKR